MVMISRFAVATTVSALFGGALAALEITTPGGPDLWWVAKSSNTMAWTCNDPGAQPTYTILIANQDVKILTAPIAIIGVENNFQCSQTITADQVNQAPATGYTIQLANPLNSSDIFAESQPFEIKALGSAYPVTTSSAASFTGSVTGSATGSGAAPSSTKTGGASMTKVSAALGVVAAAAVFGLVA